MLKKYLWTLGLLLSLPLPSFATVVTGSQVSGNMNLSYPLVYTDNPYAQKVINTDIAKYVEQAKTSYYNYYIDKVKMDYAVKYENNQYVSLLLNTYTHFRRTSHDNYSSLGLVYDKTTGSKIPFQYQVNISNLAQLETLLKNGSIHAYSETTGKELNPTDLLTPRKLSNSYYLDANGDIVSVYNPYEMSNYTNGAVHIVITPQEKDKINKP